MTQRHVKLLKPIKLLIVLLACCLVAAIGVACKKDPESYTIKYNSMGGASVKDGTYTVGNNLYMPTPSIGTDPEMYGYKFVGWYYDEECTVKVDKKDVDTSYAVDGVITLYAAWSNMHYIYFDTKTSESIEPLEYEYKEPVSISDLPTPAAQSMAGLTCDFVAWIKANTGEAVTEDFLMPSEDLYLYASYNTGVNTQFELTEKGLKPTKNPSASPVDSLSLVDDTVFSVDMTLPANIADYADDSGPVFAAGADSFTSSGTYNGDYIVMFITSNKESYVGALQFWGAKVDAQGTLSKNVCIGRYSLDGYLKDTPYAEKFKAYMESSEEETFTITMRRDGNKYYIGIDGYEYICLEPGVSTVYDEIITTNHNSGMISETLNEEDHTYVGLRAKSVNIYYTNVKVSEVKNVTVNFDAGTGTCDTESITLEYGQALTLPTPTQTGFVFEGWRYINANGETVFLENGAAFDSSTWIINAEAVWKRGDLTRTYDINFVTGIDGYTVQGITNWDGAIVNAPALAWPFTTFNGWYYDEARTQEANLEWLEVATAVDGVLTLYADSTKAPVFQGEGTATSPYLINNEADLLLFAEGIEANVGYVGCYFKLTADIALTEAWTSIGSDSVSFKGILDGDKHTVSNVKVNQDYAYAGFFATMNGATVKNLVLEVEISGTCYIGGLAGRVADCTIDNVTVKGTINGTASDVGGIVGQEIKSQTGTIISNCKNYATVITSGTGTAIVGGILAASNAKVVIENCENYGVVSSMGNFAGGIIGLMRKAEGSVVDGCKNYANVNGVANVGGLVGTNRAEVKNSYVLNTVTVSGTDAASYNYVGNYTGAGKLADVATIGGLIGQVDNNNSGKDPENCAYIKADGTVITISATVTLELDGGTLDGETTLSVNVGSPIGTLPTPTKSGFNFLGWFNGTAEVTAETVISSKEITLVAKWADDTSWDGTASTSLTGSGTEADPYLIATGCDLKFMADQVNADVAEYVSAYYQLTADINLNSIAWTPIGAQTSFKGVFDGNGKTISNLSVTSGDNAGLFGMINSATIKNLTVSGVIDAGNSAGMIVGRTESKDHTSNNLILNCKAEGSVSGGNDIGGIIGFVTRATEIKNCVNKASVKASTTGNSFAGGIVGDNNGGMIVVEGCDNYGKVEAAGTFVGGIIGLVRKVDGNVLKDCKNFADVTGKETGSVGGIVGCARVTVENCYTLNTATVNGTAASAMSLIGNYTGDKAVDGASTVGALIGQCDMNGGASEPTNCGLCDAEGNALNA